MTRVNAKAACIPDLDGGFGSLKRVLGKVATWTVGGAGIEKVEGDLKARLARAHACLTKAEGSEEDGKWIALHVVVQPNFVLAVRRQHKLSFHVFTVSVNHRVYVQQPCVPK